MKQRNVLLTAQSHLLASPDLRALCSILTPSQITPMKFHVGGTLVAAALAMQYGWAINIGGEA